jgi:hypothetical protein
MVEPKPLVDLRGANGTLQLFDSFISIDRGTVRGFLLQGAKGKKDIPLQHITSVQVKKPGFSVGFIQFSLPGGVESTRGAFSAVSDENTVTFTSQAQFQAALQVRDYIMRFQAVRSTQPTATPNDSALEALRLRLARGEITREEYERTRELMGASRRMTPLPTRPQAGPIGPPPPPARVTPHKRPNTRPLKWLLAILMPPAGVASYLLSKHKRFRWRITYPVGFVVTVLVLAAIGAAIDSAVCGEGTECAAGRALQRAADSERRAAEALAQEAARLAPITRPAVQLVLTPQDFPAGWRMVEDQSYNATAEGFRDGHYRQFVWANEYGSAVVIDAAAYTFNTTHNASSYYAAEVAKVQAEQSTEKRNVGDDATYGRRGRLKRNLS